MAFRHFRWHHFVQWVRSHKKLVISLALVVALLSGGGVFAAIKLHHKPTPPAKPKVVQHKVAPAPVPVQPTSPLTGLPVTADQAKRPVTAVMIENSPDARPQSGLDQAGVVFEAIAEGGITRFLALYQEGAPNLLGPVRSLRPYYMDWLSAFDASVAHIGGSSKALQMVRSGAYADLDEFFNGGSYWRATDRYAPHNVYTNFTKLDQLNQAKGHVASTFTGFPRKKDAPSATPNATKIQVNISGPLYNSSYTWDKSTNTYLRSEGGALHLNRETSQQLHPKTVAVIKVQETTVLEDGYRQSINAIGSGEAWIFQDGIVTHGNWTKAGQKDQIVFKDDAGAIINFNPGQTWITAIPGSTVSWQA